jgi:glutathione S-transferase
MVNYTFNYFNGRGRAEISRLILATAGVDYTDNRIEDWPATKQESPIGQLPYLTLTENSNDNDITKLPQSLAVARYLAREYDLVGTSNLSAAKCDAVVDTCIDLMTGFYNKVFLIQEEKEKAKALKEFMEKTAPKGLTSVETLVSTYGRDGHSVDDRLTWADLFVYEVTFSLMIYEKNVLSKFEGIRTVRERVEANENVANYLKNRPLTPY